MHAVQHDAGPMPALVPPPGAPSQTNRPVVRSATARISTTYRPSRPSQERSSDPGRPPAQKAWWPPEGLIRLHVPEMPPTKVEVVRLAVLCVRFGRSSFQPDDNSG